MPVRAYNRIYHNPCLNEMVYSVLRSAAPEDLLKLKGKFLKASKSERAAKFFAATSLLEEKIALLAEFGIRYFGIFADPAEVTPTNLKSILKKFMDGQKSSALDDMASLQIYVESDKEYLHLLGLMGQYSNHPSFMLNLEFNRAGYHAKKWKTTTHNVNDKNTVETIKSADYISRVMLQSILIADRSTILFKITSNQVKILIYLYASRLTYLTKEKIWNYFLGNLTKKVTSDSLMQLVRLQYVEKHLVANPEEFTITSLGIGVVNRFFQTVFNQSQ